MSVTFRAGEVGVRPDRETALLFPDLPDVPEVTATAAGESSSTVPHSPQDGHLPTHLDTR